MPALALSVTEYIGLGENIAVVGERAARHLNFAKATHGRWYLRYDDNDPITEVPDRGSSMALAADVSKFADSLDEETLGDDE